MKERPVLFSGEMIRAILDGRKTQTRRVIKPQPPGNCDTPVFDQKGRGWFYDGLDGDGNCLDSWPENDTGLFCPYQVGMRLWVRETWASHPLLNKIKPRYLDCAEIYYRATCNNDSHYSWRPSIHMPRWASRITLEVTGVRVERVKDITVNDFLAEGLEFPSSELKNAYAPEMLVKCKEGFCEKWVTLWDSINAKRGYDWSKNPAVWVVEFKRVEAEADNG